MKRTKVECDKCGRSISVSNFSRHYNSCNKKREKARENKIKDEWLQTNGLYKCPYCKKDFSKKGLGFHIWKVHREGQCKKIKKYKRKTPIWNKGLTKDTDNRVAKGALTLSKTMTGTKRKPLSEEHKKTLSDKMKQAHKENRAHNIGKSRWNNEPSYPEKFFMKVIQNEFDDKDYIREYAIGNYSMDFAWPHKMKAIEIDGQQHQRFDEYKKRDQKKDEFVKSKGWQILRLVWKDVFNNPKYWIKIANDFIR